jgi:hypothetical protein
MHKYAIICSITFIKKDKFHRINLFIQNLSIYSERQKYGINSLKIKQFFSRSGVEINFSDVNIVTEVEHFLFIFLTVVTKI